MERERPRFLVAVVGPLQGAISDHGIQNAQAIKLVLQLRGWRGGDHSVGIQVCDEASAEEHIDLPKCEANARAFARNPSVVAVVGPTTSGCAAAMLPILNDAAGGPVPLLGIGNTYLGLTRDGPGVEKGHPERLYPTARRSYLRTVPADDARRPPPCSMDAAPGRGGRSRSTTARLRPGPRGAFQAAAGRPA